VGLPRPAYMARALWAPAWAQTRCRMSGKPGLSERAARRCHAPPLSLQRRPAPRPAPARPPCARPRLRRCARALARRACGAGRALRGEAGGPRPEAARARRAQGTIEHAVSQIEAYRALLEHRVVVRFDAAAAGGDLGGMAECARIMAEFRRGEAQLVQARAARAAGAGAGQGRVGLSAQAQALAAAHSLARRQPMRRPRWARWGLFRRRPGAARAVRAAGAPCAG